MQALKRYVGFGALHNCTNVFFTLLRGGRYYSAFMVDRVSSSTAPSLQLFYRGELLESGAFHSPPPEVGTLPRVRPGPSFDGLRGASTQHYTGVGSVLIAFGMHPVPVSLVGLFNISY